LRLSVFSGCAWGADGCSGRASLVVEETDYVPVSVVSDGVRCADCVLPDALTRGAFVSLSSAGDVVVVLLRSSSRAVASAFSLIALRRSCWSFCCASLRLRTSC